MRIPAVAMALGLAACTSLVSTSASAAPIVTFAATEQLGVPDAEFVGVTFEGAAADTFTAYFPFDLNPAAPLGGSTQIENRNCFFFSA